MPKATKAAARNTKRRQAKQPGDNPTKNEWGQPYKDASANFYGELSHHVKDYRVLPKDDPYRVEIEQVIAMSERKRRDAQ